MERSFALCHGKFVVRLRKMIQADVHISSRGQPRMRHRKHGELLLGVRQVLAASGNRLFAVTPVDGRVLWSVSPELELIPASTTKLFTTGFSRTRMGGGARFTTRVIGDGRLEPGASSEALGS